MIKLKNLWKVALATMAMTAMLVACDDSSSSKSDDDDPMAIYKTNPVNDKADPFPYGFKFTSEKGWADQFMSSGTVLQGESADKVYLEIGGSPAKVINNNEEFKGVNPDDFNDDSTKFYLNKDKLVPGESYTITFDKKNGTVKLTQGGATGNEESTAIYISGYLGDHWASKDGIDNADPMKIVDAANEVYAFTFEGPAATVAVTLKIYMEDTDSTLYLRDVPVKTDGTSKIDGSIYGWNSAAGGTTITITGVSANGGIFDAFATASSNADWALDNYINGNENINIEKDFSMSGANDLLQLSIDKELWVPYIKGQISTFSWKNARNKLPAPPKAE